MYTIHSVDKLGNVNDLTVVIVAGTIPLIPSLKLDNAGAAFGKAAATLPEPLRVIPSDTVFMGLSDMMVTEAEQRSAICQEGGGGRRKARSLDA